MLSAVLNKDNGELTECRKLIQKKITDNSTATPMKRIKGAWHRACLA